MTLGEKLLQARLEAGLSQRQLCGSEITRNMLSQIEHGTARPSMSTLQYLAKQLNRPVSYFLEEEAAVSTNSACMDAAWEAYLSGNSALALEQLEKYAAPDSVYDRQQELLKMLVLLAQAEEQFAQGRIPYAQKLLDQAAQLEARQPWLPELKQRRILLLAKLGLSTEDETLPELDAWLLLHAKQALRSDNPARAVSLLEACADTANAKWALLRGRAAMALGEYGTAAKQLQQAESACPEEAVPLLEAAFRELGDYKTAYYYACKLRKLR